MVLGLLRHPRRLDDLRDASPPRLLENDPPTWPAMLWWHRRVRHQPDPQQLRYVVDILLGLLGTFPVTAAAGGAALTAVAAAGAADVAADDPAAVGHVDYHYLHPGGRARAT